MDTEVERFFARGEAATELHSLSPTAVDEDEWDTAKPPVLTPEQLARRARLRRIVAVGLAAGVALLISGIGAARLRQATKSAAPVAKTARSGVPAIVRPPPSGFFTAPASQDTRPASAAEVADPSAASPASSAASAPAAGEPSNLAAALHLVTEAKALLRAGRARDGVTSARAAIDADPTLAEAYVLAAAGLEDLGRWNEAHRTYVACVDHTRSAECRYFAARPR